MFHATLNSVPAVIMNRHLRERREGGNPNDLRYYEWAVLIAGPGFKPMGPIAPNRAPRLKHTALELSAVQVHITHYRFYREQLSPVSPKAGPAK